jgi:hypothetical protein
LPIRGTGLCIGKGSGVMNPTAKIRLLINQKTKLINMYGHALFITGSLPFNKTSEGCEKIYRKHLPGGVSK